LLVGPEEPVAIVAEQEGEAVDVGVDRRIRSRWCP
jgi:hypothetical protein